MIEIRFAPNLVNTDHSSAFIPVLWLSSSSGVHTDSLLMKISTEFNKQTQWKSSSLFNGAFLFSGTGWLELDFSALFYMFPSVQQSAHEARCRASFLVGLCSSTAHTPVCLQCQKGHSTPLRLRYAPGVFSVMWCSGFSPQREGSWFKIQSGCSPRTCRGSLCLLRLPPTLQGHAGQFNW